MFFIKFLKYFFSYIFKQKGLLVAFSTSWFIWSWHFLAVKRIILHRLISEDQDNSKQFLQSMILVLKLKDFFSFLLFNWLKYYVVIRMLKKDPHDRYDSKQLYAILGKLKNEDISLWYLHYIMSQTVPILWKHNK